MSEPWKDGVNPYVDQERRREIIRTREQRAAELEKKHKGWGKAYLAALGVRS